MRGAELRKLVTVVALVTATSCGDDRSPTAPVGPTTTDPARISAPRAAAPADHVHVVPAPTPEIARALGALASLVAETWDDDAVDRALATLLAAGPAGADALAEWLRLPEDDPRFEFARTRLPDFRVDAVPALVRLLAPGADAHTVEAALGVLIETRVAWCRSDLARPVAEAAWASLGDGEIPRRVISVISYAGHDAADLVDRLVERIGREILARREAGVDDPRPPPYALGQACLDVAAPRLAAMLANEGLRGFAWWFLGPVETPPAEAVDTLLGYAQGGDANLRARAISVIARWAPRDARCGDEARRLLAGTDAGARARVLRAWFAPFEAEDSTDPPKWPGASALDAASVRALVPMLGDADADVRWLASAVFEGSIATLPDAADIVGRGLAAARPGTADALWSAASNLDPAMFESLLRQHAPAALASSDPAARHTTLWHLSRGGSPALQEALAPSVLALLDDPDPRIRGQAARMLADLREPPRDRVAATAAALAADSSVESSERVHAVATLAVFDPDAARAAALRLLPGADSDLVYWTARYLATGPRTPDPPPGAIDRLVREFVAIRDDARAPDSFFTDGAQESIVRALYHIPGGSDAAAALVRDRLASDDRHVVVVTARWLLRSGEPAAGALLRGLSARQASSDIARIADAAADSDPALATRRLMEILPSVADDLRDLVLDRIEACGPDGARALVLSWGTLRDDSSQGRRHSLVEHEPAAVAAAVRDLAGSQDPNARAAAAEWLRDLGPPEGPALWVRLVGDRDAVVRRAALDHMDLDIDFATRARALAPLLGDERDWIRRPAVAALAVPGDLSRDVAEKLRALLADPEADIRQLAASVLVLHDVDDPACLPLLVGAIDAARRDGRIDVYDVKTCATALARLGPRAAPAAAALARALTHYQSADDPAYESTQLAILRAIRAIGPAAAPCVSAVRGALGTGSFAYVRTDMGIAVAEALGAIGPAAAPALPELRRLAAIPHFAAAAKVAIRRIEAGPR